MTFDDYQYLALKTEAPIDDKVRERFQECGGVLTAMILGDIETYRHANTVKRYIFYGKYDSDLVANIAVEDAPNELAADDRTIRLVHGWLGLASEVEELGEAILHGDFPNIAEESGDFKWYGAIVDDACEIPSSVVAAANIQKLAARYPEKFSEENALNRDLTEENAALSDVLLTE